MIVERSSLIEKCLKGRYIIGPYGKVQAKHCLIWARDLANLLPRLWLRDSRAPLARSAGEGVGG